MKRLYSHYYQKFHEKAFLIKTALFVLLAFFVFSNTLHEVYPDEFDNILGGWYMLHGKLLYTGFFTHHNPIAYILSAFIELFSWQSFVRFRIIYAALLFAYLTWSYLFLQKRLEKIDISFYIFVLLFFGMAATYFWGHMLLADNLAALFLLPVVSLLFLKSFYDKRLELTDIVAISVLSSLAILSAMTYSYLVAAIYVYTIFRYIKDNNMRIFSLEIVKIGAILLAPYFIFFCYLLLTGSLRDYFYQNMVFNQRFYIYNYPRPDGAPINPIRYAIIIAYDFFTNFSIVLNGTLGFNVNYPFNLALAVTATSLIIYLLLRGKYMLALAMVVFFVYANARTNPLTSSERDYQSSAYILFSFFAMGFLLRHLYVDLGRDIPLNKKVLFSLLLLLVGFYTFFNTTFLLRKYTEKVYGKYMGTMPLIYDRPQIAPIFNAVLDKNDTMWIGPFEFGELFYTNANVPSNYIILLPEFAKSPKIQEEMMRDFENNKPKIMYFDKRYSIRGYQPEKYAQFFLDFLSENYITLYDYRKGKTKYISVDPVSEKVDLETRLFIRKDSIDEVLKKLIEKGYIKESTT